MILVQIAQPVWQLLLHLVEDARIVEQLGNHLGQIVQRFRLSVRDLQTT